MAEIKTCEQYVLFKLEDLEWQHSNLEADYKALQLDFEDVKAKYEQLVSVIKKYAELNGFNGVNAQLTHYISFCDINEYKKEEKEDYVFLMNCLQLTDPEEEND